MLCDMNVSSAPTQKHSNLPMNIGHDCGCMPFFLLEKPTFPDSSFSTLPFFFLQHSSIEKSKHFIGKVWLPRKKMVIFQPAYGCATH